MGRRRAPSAGLREQIDFSQPCSPLCFLSHSVSVWETETIGKRNLGEDRLLIICPSSRSPKREEAHTHGEEDAEGGKKTRKPLVGTHEQEVQ